MSIRARIFIVIGAVVAVAFAQTYFVVRLGQQRNEASQEVDRATWRYEHQANLMQRVAELDSTQRAFLLTADPALRDRYDRLWGLYQYVVTMLPQYIDEPEVRRDLADLDGLIRDWHSVAERELMAHAGASADMARRIEELSTPRIRRIWGALERFDTRERNRLVARRTAANSQALEATLLTLAIPAVSIVMLLVLLVFIARILLDPLAAVARSAHQISGGNFEVSLPPASRDEIGALVRAFRDMTTAVQRRQRDLTDALSREREVSQLYATLRSKAEREHQRLLATIDTVPVALVIIDTETGRIVLQNNTAEALVGSEPEGDEERAAYWNAFRATLRDGTPCDVRARGAEVLMRGDVVVGEELIVRHPDGREIPILVSAAPLRDDKNAITGAVVAFQDITSLYEVDRLKNEFVSVVSHELRTPLTSIKGALQLLLSELPEADPDHATLLNVALANTDRLVRIINDILDISKIEAGKLELRVRRHPVNEVVALSLQNVEQIARSSSITMTTTIEEGVPDVQVDLDRTIQVIVNLLSNALKFAPPRSEVVLDARREANGMVAFSVSDRGKGIPPDKMRFLFQKFQQLDGASTRKVRGTGLGLAIVKALVEMQGGKVGVESEIGRGSTFRVTVPAARA